MDMTSAEIPEFTPAPEPAPMSEMARLVAAVAPRAFVFENVKGLTVGKHRQFLEEIIEAFQDGGYEVVTDYKVLNAAEFGVPQDRRRLFLLGARKGLSLPSYPQPTGRTTVGQAIGDLPDPEMLQELWERDWVKAKFGRPSTYAAYLRCKKEDPVDFGYRRGFDPTILTSSLLTEHSDLSRRRFVATGPGDVEPVSRFKKLSLDGICNTLRAGTASS